jgi:hypothetical protein
MACPGGSEPELGGLGLAPPRLPDRLGGRQVIVDSSLAEAKRQIEEAHRLQSDTLDLGNLVPAELGDLPHIRCLFIGVQRPAADPAFITSTVFDILGLAPRSLRPRAGATHGGSEAQSGVLLSCRVQAAGATWDESER